MFSVQEKLKHEQLRQELELKSSDRDEQVQRAFAAALEMQQKSEEEAAALGAELSRTERKRQEDINALTEQVGQHRVEIYLCFAQNIWLAYFFFIVVVRKYDSMTACGKRWISNIPTVMSTYNERSPQQWRCSRGRRRR